MDKSSFSRNKALDVMRIAAAIAVVTIHVSASRLYASSINSADFVFSYLYDCLSRFGVPFFFMISGVLFLDRDKDLPIRKLWTHNILRIVIVYLLWSALYTLPVYFAGNGWNGIAGMINAFSQSAYHLWFLPVIVAIYILVPFLRTWQKVASKRETELFLLLFVVINIMVKTVNNVNLSYSLTQLLKMFDVDYFPVHLCYFILGYYLYTYRVKSFSNMTLCITTIVSFAINVVYGVLASRHEGTVVLGLFDFDNITTLVAVCSLFLLLLQLNNNVPKSKCGNAVIRELSSDSLGVYLVHLFLVSKLTASGTVFNEIPAVFSVPLLVLIVFTLSVAASAILRRIPVVGRYIC